MAEGRPCWGSTGILARHFFCLSKYRYLFVFRRRGWPSCEELFDNSSFSNNFAIDFNASLGPTIWLSTRDFRNIFSRFSNSGSQSSTNRGCLSVSHFGPVIGHLSLLHEPPRHASTTNSTWKLSIPDTLSFARTSTSTHVREDGIVARDWRTLLSCQLSACARPVAGDKTSPSWSTTRGMALHGVQ